MIPQYLMMIFTSDPAVIAEGIKYLRIVAFTYLMIGVTQAYLYVMRSVERVVVATVVYLCSLICNIIMNSIFIFGLFGLPAMGSVRCGAGDFVRPYSGSNPDSRICPDFQQGDQAPAKVHPAYGPQAVS